VLLSLGLGLFLAEIVARGLVWYTAELNRSAFSQLADGSPARTGEANIALRYMLQRSDNERLIYELLPDLRVQHRFVPVATNALGFRGPAMTRDKPEGTKRLMVVGDSVVFGWGIPADSTLTSLVCERLRRRGRMEIECLNLGVPGYNTAMEVEALASRWVSLEPDLVLLDFVHNDADLPNFLRTDVDPFSLRTLFLGHLFSGLRDAETEGPADGLVPAPRRSAGRQFLGDPARVPARYRDMVGPEAGKTEIKRLLDDPLPANDPNEQRYNDHLTDARAAADAGTRSLYDAYNHYQHAISYANNRNDPLESLDQLKFENVMDQLSGIIYERYIEAYRRYNAGDFQTARNILDNLRQNYYRGDHRTNDPLANHIRELRNAAHARTGG